MRLIGFSTGALAKGDFTRGIQLQRQRGIRAVELSALRYDELAPLVSAVPSLDLSDFEHVSFHAPSRIQPEDEQTVFELLSSLPPEWPIVVHPGITFTPSLWRTLGARLCIENMDARKQMGRTVSEVRSLFGLFPEASLCLDVGHARQVDPTMASAILMLTEHRARLRQIHVSDIGPMGEHHPLGPLSKWAYARVARKIPRSCPLIIESVVPASAISREIEVVAAAFTPQAQENRSALQHS